MRRRYEFDDEPRTEEEAAAILSGRRVRRFPPVQQYSRPRHEPIRHDVPATVAAPVPAVPGRPTMASVGARDSEAYERWLGTIG
jgi:hypothetical protein